LVKAPGNLIIKWINAYMVLNNWNKNKYLISGYPRHKIDMGIWNEKMTPLTSTMGVLYLNQTY